MSKIQSLTHAQRAGTSLEGRRVVIRGEDPSLVYFVTCQRDAGAPVPLNERPGTGDTVSLVRDVPPVNPWRRSTWPSDTTRRCLTSDVVPVSETRRHDEHTFGCAVRVRMSWDQSAGRCRAVNCICGADPLDAQANVIDFADESVSGEAVSL